MSNNDPIQTMNSTRMDMGITAPNLFMPHPCFSAEVNRNIAQSEIEGGVHLDELSEGAVLEVETQHHLYTIVKHAREKALISGHPSSVRSLSPLALRAQLGAALC
jgi:hypothetical protein